MTHVDALPPLVSVVIPVFRSAAIVSKTVDATLAVLRDLGESFEVILVNDGSPDDSWEVISGLARDHPEITSIDLLRNYGQHSAVMCGLARSTGGFVFTIDDDLQNPPSELPKMLDAARTGDHDLVVGRFPSKKHSIGRRWGSSLIAMINRKVFGNPHAIVMTNVRCIRRDLVDRVVAYRTAKPYVTGLCLRYTGSPVNVTVEHHERAEGQSNYSVMAIASLVLRILFAYSNWPLRFVSNLGILVAGLSFVFGMVVFLRSIIQGTSLPGWASTVVLLAFFNGISILILGMLGEYTVRVLNQVSSEQPYLIRETVGDSAGHVNRTTGRPSS